MKTRKIFILSAKDPRLLSIFSIITFPNSECVDQNGVKGKMASRNPEYNLKRIQKIHFLQENATQRQSALQETESTARLVEMASVCVASLSRPRGDQTPG